MLSDEKLIAWLCFMRLQWGQDFVPAIPPDVTDALISRGWFVQRSDLDWNGERDGTLTDAGVAMADIHGPDWGIKTIPQESET